MGAASRNNPMRVFNWTKAAELIRDQQPYYAAAGLQGDWEWTGGMIWENGQIMDEDDTYTYLSSTWAIPELDLDGDVVECWIWMSDSPGWIASTYWPPEARALLEEGRNEHGAEDQAAT